MSSFSKAADVLKARSIEKEREEKRRELEFKKKQVEEAHQTIKVLSIADKFQTYESNEFQDSLGGIVTSDDLKLNLSSKKDADKQSQPLSSVKRKPKDKVKSMLSFESEDESEQIETKHKKHKTSLDSSVMSKDDPTREDSNSIYKSSLLLKDPTIETSFLPDQERDQHEALLREQFEQEWAKAQEKERNEKIEVVYSYWDGTGHRRSVTVTKGTSIRDFLEQCRRNLLDSFHELRSLSAEALLYIKEDLIIPQHYTFYDLIIIKARGKSGPLFHFGLREDVRLVGDARLETDSSHAGKVVTRTWYERNKHIFPATRWEVYDPNVTYK